MIRSMGKNLEWQPIATAPADVDLELSVYEPGEYVALVFPCRRESSGWLDANDNRPVPLKPTHWRPWDAKRVK
jgi:hypothetical protein